MKERVTQALLSAIVVLLVIHLFRGIESSPVQAGTGQTLDVLRGRALEIVDDRGRVRASIKVHSANPKVTIESKRPVDVDFPFRTRIANPGPAFLF
jgi:hypothetical protein